MGMPAGRRPLRPRCRSGAGRSGPRVPPMPDPRRCRWPRPMRSPLRRDDPVELQLGRDVGQRKGGEDVEQAVLGEPRAHGDDDVLRVPSDRLDDRHLGFDCFCSFTLWKTGDSATFIRIQMPTITRRKLTRKGTRQPQVRKCGLGHAWRPPGTPAWRAAGRCRRRSGARSRRSRAGWPARARPPSAPRRPTRRPGRSPGSSRMATRRTGAQMPMVA